MDIEENLKILWIIKAITILIRPNIKCLEQYNYHWINLNMIESVIFDLTQHKDFLNVLYGVNLMLLRPIMTNINLVDCEGVKI